MKEETQETGRVQYRDLREWLELVEKAGQLRRVKGARAKDEIGPITEMVTRTDEAPVVMFSDIPGYPEGHRVVVNSLANSLRLGLTFGLPTELSRVEMSMQMGQRLKSLDTMPPVVVDGGPVTENVLMGKDVDLGLIPVPLWHEDDGGPYIGTGSFDITKDPDTGLVNLGTYRVMAHDKNHVGFYISPGKHGRIHRDKWFARGERMPVAIVCGADPLLFLSGCTEVPLGVTEYEWAGGLRGFPYRVFPGRVTGLPLPADAEIVLEGWAYPDVSQREGPFGEWAGYYASGAREEPVVEVEAMYFRNDPILVGSPPMRPPDEQARFRAFLRSALLKDEMEKAGVPGVQAVWAHEVGGTRLFLAVGIRQQYPGHARQAGFVASQCHVGAYTGRFVVVVDDDIDVSDLGHVVWAMSTRCDPAEDIDIIRRAWSTPLDPRISPEDRQRGKFMNSRAIIDATRPWEWRDKFPRVNEAKPELRESTLAKWGWILR